MPEKAATHACMHPNYVSSVNLLLLCIISVIVSTSGCVGLTKSSATNPPPSLAITAALPVGSVYGTYEATMSATGGVAPYTWSAFPSLPQGLGLAPETGTISGTPTQPGTSSIIVQVKDSASPAQTAVLNLNIKITGSVTPVQITTSSLPRGQTGSTYSTTLAAIGGRSPYSWSVTSGLLPAGLTLSSSGQIGGGPTQSETSSFTVQVKDSSLPAQTATANLSILVSTSVTPVQITTSSLPDGQVNSNYSAILVASGGKTPYSWSITSGLLPGNLSLGASSGQINGTPTQSGTSSFTVQVKDSSSLAQTASHVYAVVIAAAGTGTPITSCQSLTNSGTIYVLQNDVSAPRSCFNIQNDNITLDLNGHTITYGNTLTPPALAVFGIYGAAASDPNFSSGIASGNPTGGSWNNLTVAGPGTIMQGNCLDLSNTIIGSNAIHMGQGAGHGLSVFNVTFNICADSTQAIFADSNGSGYSIHDNTVNSKVVSARKRSVFQGMAFLCNGCKNDNGAPSNFYNNTITGGPQGCIMWNNPNTNIFNNTCSHGNPKGAGGLSASLTCEAIPYTNAAGTLPIKAGTQCTNDFGLYARTNNGSVFGNNVTPREGRGLFIGASNGATVHDNVVNAAQEFPNNSEYGGCEIGGAFGLQFDDNPTNATVYNNNVTAQAGACTASAFRVTDSESYGNVSRNNTYTAKRAASPDNCTGMSLTAPQNCAFGASFDGTSNGIPLQVTSESDIFTADSALLFFDWAGPTNQALLISPTFTKGSNPDPNYFHFAVFRNGVGTANVHIRDASFGPGVSPTDTDLPAQSPNNKAASLYLDWTLTLAVQNQAGNPVTGATVTYTNSLSSKECSTTTNSSGVASCILTQDRINNDRGANQIENHNPFSFSISAPGCTTLTGRESITTKTSETKQLSGC